ncbi:MAG: ABC transporter permease [Bacilli bacterium]|nr:ABC transporter permease [Bacilli bacterium]
MRNQIQKFKRDKNFITFCRIGLFVAIILLWEVGAKTGILDEFLFSSPSAILNLLIKYIVSKEIWRHLFISVLETVAGIIFGTLLGILIAIILWANKFLSKVVEPLLVLLNALPKTALAPIMIIWAGTGVTGIVVVSISILIVVTIISTYNYFINVDKEKIKMLKSFGATKTQLFTNLIFPSNLVNIINVVKINIGLAWVGVIVGEFLVSRAGLGYLIMYGGQVFRLDLVMMGVVILCLIAYLMYAIVNLIEIILIKKRGKKI